MPTVEHKTIVERWFREIFEQGKMDVIDELVAPGLIAHAPGNGPPSGGRDAFKHWLQWHRASFTDQHWTIHDILSDGEKAVVRYAGYTMYRGGLFDLPATNQPVLETGIIIFRIADGQVQEMWSEMSDLQVVFQLGASLTVKQDETA
jgi:predicted ester cyclase